MRKDGIRVIAQLVLQGAAVLSLSFDLTNVPTDMVAAKCASSQLGVTIVVHYAPGGGCSPELALDREHLPSTPTSIVPFIRPVFPRF